ncbi:MAG: EAL domain-containing protein [Sphingomonadales bacterium]
MGAVAFILAVVAASDGTSTSQSIARGLSIAIVCAILSWASAERALSGVAAAMDSAIERIVDASRGDLSTPTPDIVGSALPQLSGALDGMFAKVRSNLESATTMALFDPVTSLANRTHFRAEAERVLEGLGKDEIALLAFIDLDQFKAVNDTFGHANGDLVLGKIANRLRTTAAAETLRQPDRTVEPIIGRLAGDEFTVLFGHIDGLGDAERLGAELLASLMRPINLGDQKIVVGASIGLALATEHGETLTKLMRAADVAMYQAKANGRGQFQFYAEAMAERMAQRSRLETELRAAIANDEFTLVFQPQIALATGQVQAVEGLLRWNHPIDGLRLPISFLACAEESGLMGDISDRIVDSFAQRVATWPRDALAPRLGVNIGKHQMSRPEFFANLRGALYRHNASMSAIEFEISESILMDCSSATIAQIVELREQGARIAIDDFGSGSSSLALLRSMPFDTIKLDNVLIAGIDTDPAARDIAHAVVGLIHSLGAQAVAEGVENDLQLDMLRVMGCDAAQGYAIAPPMTEDDCRFWMANTRDRMVA